MENITSFVAQIAKQQGLKVIASAGSESKINFLKQIGVDVAFNYKKADTREVLAKEGPINLSVFLPLYREGPLYKTEHVYRYWDNVGGETLEAALDNAATYARFIECGMISGYNKTPTGVRVCQSAAWSRCMRNLKARSLQNMHHVFEKSISMFGFIVTRLQPKVSACTVF
jgi:NADPH-dependent curcumin reductase CurA